MLEYQGEVREGQAGKPVEPFQIVVKDDEGNPLPNHPLEFMVVEGKGRFEYADSSTDQTGSAIAEFIPENGGRFRVECRVGEERREIAIFKGVVEDAPSPKRRQRIRTVRPPASAPSQTAAPQAIVPPPLPPPEIAKPAVTEEPPAPPPPADVVIPVPVATAALPVPAVPAAPAPKPAAPVRAAARAPAALTATVTTRTAARARPAAKRQRTPPPSPAVRALLIAVIVITALIAILSGILVAQETAPRRVASEAPQGRVLQTVPAHLVSPR